MLKVLKEKGEMVKTAIMSLSRLDWRNFKDKFTLLQEKELIAVTNEEENLKKYGITEKGLEYIIEFKKLQKILA